MSELRITESRLHQYLADAYKRGADHEASGRLPDDYERRIRESESWAREFVDLRMENGLLALLDSSEPVGEVVRDQFATLATMAHETDTMSERGLRRRMRDIADMAERWALTSPTPTPDATEIEGWTYEGWAGMSTIEITVGHLYTGMVPVYVRIRPRPTPDPEGGEDDD